jgi:hypothetical protein
LKVGTNNTHAWIRKIGVENFGGGAKCAGHTSVLEFG